MKSVSDYRLWKAVGLDGMISTLSLLPSDLQAKVKEVLRSNSSGTTGSGSSSSGVGNTLPSTSGNQVTPAPAPSSTPASAVGTPGTISAAGATGATSATGTPGAAQ